jgi:catalase
MKIMVQLAAPGDNVDDATCVWPENREEVEFGTISISEIANDLEPDLRKIIFDPIPRIGGIEASADPLIEVRSQIYLLSGRRRRQHSSS